MFIFKMYEGFWSSNLYPHYLKSGRFILDLKQNSIIFYNDCTSPSKNVFFFDPNKLYFVDKYSPPSHLHLDYQNYIYITTFNNDLIEGNYQNNDDYGFFSAHQHSCCTLT